MQHLLFFAGHRMLAYRWSANRFRAAHAFEPGDAGYREFERFLQALPAAPLRLMVDMVEEGFRLETMPRVFGTDRRALVQRLLARHFRATEYRHLKVQERQRSGRGDLRVLLCGLTNPEPLNGWVDIIRHSGVPLEGVYSLALVGAWLLPCLGVQRASCLLITQQSSGAVRQSFYQQGRLRLSRLLPLRHGGYEGYAGFVRRETRSTLQFLESQGLLRSGEPIQVHVVGPARRLAALQRGPVDEGALLYRTWDYGAAARRAGLRGALPGDFADGLFAHLLCRRWRPVNHYATSEMRRHYVHRQARIALNALSCAAVLAAVVLGGATTIEGRLYERYALAAQGEAARYERLYARLLRGISAFPLQAAYVKEAVDLVRELDGSIHATPETLMRRVGALLDRHPNITLHELQWLSDTDATVLPGQPAQSPRGRQDTAFVPGPRHEIAVLRGQVVDFGRSRRGAVELFQRFVHELRGDARFVLIAVRRTPFDIDPQAAIAGDSGLGAPRISRDRAGYELLLRLRHGDVRT